MILKDYWTNEIIEGAKSKDEALFYNSLRESLARQMSKNIWGGGFQFSSGNDSIENKFKKINHLNKLDNLFSYIEKYCSMYGRAVITINKTDSGDFMLSMNSPIWYNGVGKVFIQPQLAIIYQRFTVGNNMYVVKSTYTNKYVKNELYTNYDGKVIRVFDKETEIFKELRIKKFWEHNLGFPPIIEFTNLPFYQFNWLTEEFVRLSDWYPAVQFEKLIWTTAENLRKELAFNHSRIVIDGNQTILNRLRGDNDFGSLSIEERNEFIISAENGGADVKFQPGNGDFTKYTSTMEHLMDFYFKLSGSSRFSEGGGAQKTVAETSTIRSSMIETINQKMVLRQKQCVDLISKMLCCYGAITKEDYWNGTTDFEFKINGNILEDETSHIDNQLKLIQNGIISPIDFIQDLFKLNRVDAEKKFEEVKKFNEENDIMNVLTSHLEEEGSDDGESNFNQATGEHKDLAKQGKA